MPEPHDWETDPRPFSDCLKAWAGAHGWTRSRCAEELRTSRATYDGYCDGRHCRHEASLRRLMTLIDRTGS